MTEPDYLAIAPAQTAAGKKKMMEYIKVKTDEDFYRNRAIENLKEIHNVTRLRQLIIISEKMRKRELSDVGSGEKGEKCSGTKISSSGAILPEKEIPEAVLAESTDTLVYRETTIQILNRIHSVDIIRKIYTFAKYLEEKAK